jgi:uncharacterized protein YecE (DUF72 family)
LAPGEAVLRDCANMDQPVANASVRASARWEAMHIRIGTAGWSIASRYADAFPQDGMALTRYAQRMSCAEINSSFYRSHRPSTWTRWGELVPDTFRFSVKIPRSITHERRLKDCEEPIRTLVEETAGLGEKLAVFLVQLPPTLGYDADAADAFFRRLGGATSARIACEPRHRSWFEPAADDMLARHCIARVAADPPRVAAGAEPGGWRGFAYWRLHGSPDLYRSPYEAAELNHYARRIAAGEQQEAWCIFDNTASSAATGDALALAALVAA